MESDQPPKSANEKNEPIIVNGMMTRVGTVR